MVLRPLIRVEERKFLGFKKSNGLPLYLLKCDWCSEKVWGYDTYGLVLTSPYVVRDTPIHRQGLYMKRWIPWGYCIVRAIQREMDIFLEMFGLMEKLRGELSDRELALCRWCVGFIERVTVREDFNYEAFLVSCHAVLMRAVSYMSIGVKIGNSLCLV